MSADTDSNAAIRMPARGASGGLAAALLAYALWGVFPLYFLALQPATPLEILGWRILFALLVSVVLVVALRNARRRLRQVIRHRRTVLLLGLAAVTISVNWLVYIAAVLSGHVVEAALGYFINPLLTVLLGVLVLREKLHPLQWTALAIGAIAVIVIAVGYGEVPWISLALAASFGLYGLLKNRVGGSVDAVSGLAVETAWLAPVGVALLGGYALVTGGLSITDNGAGHAALLAASGIATAAPLLLFAAATRRLPLSLVGLTQYLTPVLQFILGVVVLHEEMPPARWAGFALVWVALVVLTTHLLLVHRHERRVALRSRVQRVTRP